MFRKLKSTSEGFLQVLIKEFILGRTKTGISLDISVDDSSECLIKSSEKRELKELITPENREKLSSDLGTFFENPDFLAHKFSFSGSPLRFANGGVLPIITIENKEYFCLFYRTIEPIGWNIANGASNNLAEIINPEKVVYREFSEEFIITDQNSHSSGGQNNKLLLFKENEDFYSTGSQDTALKLWSEKLDPEHNIADSYEKLALPIKWINGPDELIIRSHRSEMLRKGFFISVLPEDNSIELDKIAIIKLNRNARILDGEIDIVSDPIYGSAEVLVNRIIGLFPVEEMISKLPHERVFLPSIIYHSGKEWDPEELSKLVEFHINESQRSILSYDPGAIKKYIQNKQCVFNLCPVTRSIITKYLNWREFNRDVNDEIEYKSSPDIEGKFKVFISFKSEDEQVAHWLYEFLQVKGIKTFCSGKTIRLLGESDYARAIDFALDESSILVIIATNKAHFNSEWVEYEWNSFNNEIRSGYKPHGQIFTFTHNLSPRDMPYALRSRQNVPYSSTSVKDSFDNLYQFIHHALFSKSRHVQK